MIDNQCGEIEMKKLTEAELRRIVLQEMRAARRGPSMASFLFEDDSSAGIEKSGSSAGGVKSSDLIKMTLGDFITQVDSNQKDVLSAILSGQSDKNPDDDKASIEATDIPVMNLSPTQSEVVIDKSLPFTLGKPNLFKNYITTNGPFAVGVPGKNDAIITLNGKFVIDGHHRWSSLFCFNPLASIKAFNISMPGLTPNQALIATQAAIISKAGKRPTASGGGVNLFNSNRGDIKAVVDQVVNDELSKAYAAFMNETSIVKRMEEISGAKIGDIKESRLLSRILEADSAMGSLGPTLIRAKLTAFCWGNVQKLQTRTPIPGATAREDMPQADVVGPVSATAGTPPALEKLALGDVDIKAPFAESRRSEDDVLLERWQKLAGILKG